MKLQQVWQRYQCTKGNHTWNPQVAFQFSPSGPQAGMARSCRWCRTIDWGAWRPIRTDPVEGKRRDASAGPMAPQMRETHRD